MDIGWLPEPCTRAYWNDLLALLEPAARRGGCEPYEADDLVWIATEDGQIIGAATTRLLDGEAELKHVAGTRFREWVPPLEELICLWAKACGARKMVSRGRYGWERINRSMGWQKVGEEDGLTLYEKAL